MSVMGFQQQNWIGSGGWVSSISELTVFLIKYSTKTPFVPAWHISRQQSEARCAAK